MASVPLVPRERETRLRLPNLGVDGGNWARVAAGGSLVAAGVLLLTGNRKAGLVSAAAGTTLAVIDQQDTVKSFWSSLPRYIDHAQRLLHQVEDTVSEVAAQRERLNKIINR
jgi:hypothetical protein